MEIQCSTHGCCEALTHGNVHEQRENLGLARCEQWGSQRRSHEGITNRHNKASVLYDGSEIFCTNPASQANGRPITQMMQGRLDQITA